MSDSHTPPSPAGLLVIDKPRGPTSTSVCRLVKARLRRAGAPRTVKVGHGGTLDPLASGVLVVLVGRAATRLCEEVMAGEKRYTAHVDLSHRSTTDDGEGELTEISVLRPPTRAEIESVCARFVGRIMQTPPAHSAMMVGGRRAYEMARRGEEPGLRARPVTIHSIDIVEYEWPRLVIDVRCGKGVYIRSLARDIGLALGPGAMLADLRRTAVGEYTVDRATTLDALPEAIGQSDLIPVPPLA